MTVCDKHCLVIIRYHCVFLRYFIGKAYLAYYVKRGITLENARRLKCKNSNDLKLDPLVRSLSDLRERIKGSDFNKLVQMRK